MTFALNNGSLVTFQPLHDLGTGWVVNMTEEEKILIGTTTLRYPKNVCHRLTQNIVISMPDTPICKAYVEWYSSGNHGTVSLMTRNESAWREFYGKEIFNAMIQSMEVLGRPRAQYQTVFLLPGHQTIRIYNYFIV